MVDWYVDATGKRLECSAGVLPKGRRARLPMGFRWFDAVAAIAVGAVFRFSLRGLLVMLAYLTARALYEWVKIRRSGSRDSTDKQRG